MPNPILHLVHRYSNLHFPNPCIPTNPDNYRNLANPKHLAPDSRRHRLYPVRIDVLPQSLLVRASAQGIQKTVGSEWVPQTI